MKYELKAIGYWSLIKISFVINLIVGFVLGLFVAMFIGAFLSLAGRMSGLAGMPMEGELPSAGFMVVFLPFLYGFGAAIFNTILFVIVAFVYNVMAKLVGGIELEFSEMHLQPATYATSSVTQPPTYYTQIPTPPPPPPPVQPLPPEIIPPPDEGDK